MYLIVKKKAKLAYLIMPKAGSTTIPRTFFPSVETRTRKDKRMQRATKINMPMLGWNIILSAIRPSDIPMLHTFNLPAFVGFSHTDSAKGWQVSGFNAKTKSHQTHSLAIEELRAHFTFTFVRNPFQRLVSFFQNFIIYDEKQKMFHTQPKILMRPFYFKDFSDFIEQAIAMKDKEMDAHFRPQTSFLDFFFQTGGKIDFIGKLENIDEGFEVLRKKFNLLPLERFNDSTKQNKNVLHKNWRDYYTPELAKRVFDRWHRDFVELGYEREYPLLLTHLKAPLPLGWRFRGKRFLTHLKVKMQPLLIARWRKRQFFAKLGLPSHKKYLP